MSLVTFGTINTLVQQFRSIYAGEDLYDTNTVTELTHDALHVRLGLPISEWGEQQITTYHFGIIGVPFHLVPPIEGVDMTSFSDEEWGVLWGWYQQGCNEYINNPEWNAWLKKYSPLPLFELSSDVEEASLELEYMLQESSLYIKEVMEILGFN